MKFMSWRGISGVVALVIGLLGCSDQLAQPPVQSAGVPASQGSVVISAATTTLRVGEDVVLFATAVDGNGMPIQGASVHWRAETPGIVQVLTADFPVAHVRGLTAGVGIVTAESNGQSKSISLTVNPLPAPSGSAIVIDEFTVVEFQYPSAPGRWFYAPLVKVRETKLGMGAAIVAYDFIIPGLGSAPACNTYRPVGPGASLDLFREVYGDYGYTIDHGTVRATGQTATALISVVDGSSAPYLVTATGPIISGSLPTTYTGGTVNWACQ